MRYIRSLNSNWFQNGKPSKLKDWKNVCFTIETDSFFIFQLWRLAILEPVGVQRPNVPHFKGLIKPNWNQKRPRAWHHFYYGSRPLEKGHFTLKKGFVAFVLSRTVELWYGGFVVYWELDCIFKLEARGASECPPLQPITWSMSRI